MPKNVGNLHGTADGNSVNLPNYVARSNPRLLPRRVRNNHPRLNAMSRIPPGYAVIRRFKPRPLVEIQDGKYHRRHRGYGQNDRSNPCSHRYKDGDDADAWVLLHFAALSGYTPSYKNGCNSCSNLW